MARLGAFCFAGTGHINPMTALARRLQARGHEVILFGIRDIEARVRVSRVGFCPIGGGDYPLGTLARLDRVLAEKKGLETFRFTVDRVKNTALMVLRDGPGRCAVRTLMLCSSTRPTWEAACRRRNHLCRTQHHP